MPVISRFLGIIISMYWNDHLPPHFHAKYGEYEITVNIKNGVIEGKFPKRALKLVLEWYELHKDELKKNWELCRQQEPTKSIQPLE
ncbi:Transcriptional regulator [Candidatus Magnetomoraceae bacterium gMMP-1]